MNTKHICSLFLLAGVTVNALAQPAAVRNEYFSYVGMLSGAMMNTPERSLAIQALPMGGIAYRRKLSERDSVSVFVQGAIEGNFMKGSAMDTSNRLVSFTEIYFQVPLTIVRKRRINRFMELNTGIGVYYNVLDEQHNEYFSPARHTVKSGFGQLMKAGVTGDVSLQFLSENKAGSVTAGFRVDGDAITLMQQNAIARQYLRYGFYLGIGRKF